MTTRMTLVTFAAALVAATPLHAQAGHAGHGAGQNTQDHAMMCTADGMQHSAAAQHHGAGGAGQHGDMHAMMGGYAANPGMLLHHTDDLGLTANQVERIKALQTAAQQDCAQHMKLAHEEFMAAAMALQGATPNLATYETQLREASQHMVQAHVAMARRGIEALNLLTAAQRAKLQARKHDND